MKRLSKILGTALAVSLALAAVAAAATLGVSSKVLSAGNAAVSTCGVSSPTASRHVDNSGNVTEVDVAGIPAACQGQTLSVTLENASKAAIGSASTTLSGCTSTCSAALTSFGGTVSAANLASYAFGITGS